MDGDKELIEKIGRILNGCSCSICILNADKAIALVRENDGRRWDRLHSASKNAKAWLSRNGLEGNSAYDDLVSALDAIPQSAEPPAPAAEPRYTMAEQLTQLTEAKAGWDSCISDLKKAADICSQIETENAALKREVAMWRSEHDPCPFSLENETLRAENERLEKQVARFLEPISDEERRVANHWTGCWTKDEVEALIANRLEPKGRPINPPQEPK